MWNFFKKKTENEAESLVSEEAVAEASEQLSDIVETEVTEPVNEASGDAAAATAEAEITLAAEDKEASSENDTVSEVTEETLSDIDNSDDADVTTAEKKKGFFARLKDGLSKTRKSISSGLGAVFGGFSSIDDDFYEELEEILIMSDIGITASESIIDALKSKVKEQKIKEPEACRQLLIDSIAEQMSLPEDAFDFENETAVVMVIGVNGAGKTTSVGKLAAKYKNEGKRVLVAAADTFRAAAIDQLATWTERAGVEMISQSEGSDPAAVVYDAVCAAKSRKSDILLCDTAGRLHNKKNLMDELAKINRVIDREYPNAKRETFVVLDGTTGQNALAQAKQFGEAANITGIILTKLDGTAKGGIAIAIQKELSIPVKYIGVGEHLDDLQRFDPHAFVEALFE